MTPAPAVPHAQVAHARWALMFGNFAIGCGVMVVAGSLNDIVRSLQVSVALGGQLISVAAALMCFAAPLMAVVVGRIDRRWLLTAALLWYAAGHALSALAPSFALLLPVRTLTMLGAAVFTPQAAAAIGQIAPPEDRGRSMVFIFLGWSVASVAGVPVSSFIGETFGWRWAFGLVAVLSVGVAGWVWAVMPRGVRPPAMRLAAWRGVVTQPLLMTIVLVTALASAGQFTLFAYMAPYARQAIGIDAAGVSLLFGWFGACGLVGNLLLTRYIGRFGAATLATLSIAAMGLSMVLWPLATGTLALALVILPWGLGCFASNSAQQARLGEAAPAQASALMALNTSAIYLGQAIGPAGGGALVAAHAARGDQGTALYGSLHWIGLAWLVLAVVLSIWTQRRMSSAVPIDASTASSR